MEAKNSGLFVAGREGSVAGLACADSITALEGPPGFSTGRKSQRYFFLTEDEDQDLLGPYSDHSQDSWVVGPESGLGGRTDLELGLDLSGKNSLICLKKSFEKDQRTSGKTYKHNNYKTDRERSTRP